MKYFHFGVCLGALIPLLGFAQTVTYPSTWTTLHEDSGWTLVIEKDRLRVFEKELSVSPVPAFRTELKTYADPESLLDRIWAVDRYPETLPSAYITHAGFFERSGKKQTAWQVVDIPFLSPRYYQFEQLRQSNRIDWFRSDSLLLSADMQDLLVAPVNFGSWEIILEPDDITLVYRVCTDPGGAIPAWVVRRANRQALPSVMLELEAEALKHSLQKTVP